MCLFDEGWHQGVVGLVAGRLKDRLHRPVIAFARAEGGSLRGSARSVAGIHIRDVLDGIATRHPGLIEKFGGHAMAAGMSLPEANLETFRAAFAARSRGARRRGGLARRHSQRRRVARRRRCARDRARAAARRAVGAGISGAGVRRRLRRRRRSRGRRQALEAAAARGRRGAPSGALLDAIAFGYVDAAMEDPARDSRRARRSSSRTAWR